MNECDLVGLDTPFRNDERIGIDDVVDARIMTILLTPFLHILLKIETDGTNVGGILHEPSAQSELHSAIGISPWASIT